MTPPDRQATLANTHALPHSSAHIPTSPHSTPHIPTPKTRGKPPLPPFETPVFPMNTLQTPTFIMNTLAISTLVLTTSASAGIVTFDNLPPLSDQSAGQRLMVPVDGFSFTTSGTYYESPYAWYYYNPNSYTSQHLPVLDIGVRGTTAIYSGWYQTAYPTYKVSRTDGSLWQFNKAFFTAMWGLGTIHLIGLRDGTEVFNFTQSISDTQQTMVSMSSYPGPVQWIDTLKIGNDLAGQYGNRHFIMDDMYYTLPAPGAFALMACGLFGTRSRRRKDSE